MLFDNSPAEEYVAKLTKILQIGIAFCALVGDLAREIEAEGKAVDVAVNVIIWHDVVGLVLIMCLNGIHRGGHLERQEGRRLFVTGDNVKESLSGDIEAHENGICEGLNLRHYRRIRHIDDQNHRLVAHEAARFIKHVEVTFILGAGRLATVRAANVSQVFGRVARKTHGSGICGRIRAVLQRNGNISVAATCFVFRVVAHAVALWRLYENDGRVGIIRFIREDKTAMGHGFAYGQVIAGRFGRAPVVSYSRNMTDGHIDAGCRRYGER